MDKENSKEYRKRLMDKQQVAYTYKGIVFVKERE